MKNINGFKEFIQNESFEVEDMAPRQTRKKKPGHQLFNDNPRGAPRTRGIGQGTPERVRRSIHLLKGKPRAQQRQVATTMQQRAKYHKQQTEGMREAMKLWKKYLDSL